MGDEEPSWVSRYKEKQNQPKSAVADPKSLGPKLGSEGAFKELGEQEMFESQNVSPLRNLQNSITLAYNKGSQDKWQGMARRGR